MPKNVIVIGAGGHGKVIADIVLSSGDIVKGFLDDTADLQGKSVVGFPVLGVTADYKNFMDCEFVIAVGNPYVREKISDLPVKWYTAIHPSAVISSLGVEIGEGTVIMANAVVNPCAKIGRHCIINTGAMVEHDNLLENFVHLSPNCALAGTVKVGKSTHIGVGVCVKNNVNITHDCVIGAGAAVIKDIVESGTYVGVPVRKIK